MVVVDPSHLNDCYDYVIIGGGTSGLTVANRLTEDPESKFALRCAALISLAPQSTDRVLYSIRSGD